MHERLEICVDCAMVVANGDYTDLSDDTAKAIDRSVGEWRTAGYWLAVTCPPFWCDQCGEYVDDDTCRDDDPDWPHQPIPNDDCECIGFSWHFCDICDSGLGGSRFHAAAIKQEAHV